MPHVASPCFNLLQGALTCFVRLKKAWFLTKLRLNKNKSVVQTTLRRIDESSEKIYAKVFHPGRTERVF
jgi:hypothetical protein